MDEVKEGENILTINTETNEIEIKPIQSVIRYQHKGKMVNITGGGLDDTVTQNHLFPIYDNETKEFKCFISAEDIFYGNICDGYIPDSTENFDEGISVRDLVSTELEYAGDVLCVQVENHVWYVMDNGKCH